MKYKRIMILSILIFVLLTACSGNEVRFTPSVLEIPTATNPVKNTPIPTGTDIQTIENDPTPEEEKTDEGAPDTVKTFPDPSQYQWQEITTGLIKPLGMTSYYDGDMLIYVLEQDGIIRVLENGVLLPEPFLDIKNETTTRGSEQGLLGIALDPNYADNGIFYLNYSGRGGDTVIAKYVANDGRKIADPGSEQIILTYEQPYSNHNGGNLVFGPDGLLYIGLGDGGSGGDPEMRAQNPDTLLGKMLRIAVQNQEIYAIPSDNPYQVGGSRAEIWAMGLRNPWRFSFDRLTGDLWIADVGQSNWEEINFSPANPKPGLNYGWYYREGTHPFKGEPPESIELIDPIYEYDHSMGCSVTGGYVYRGTELPEWYGVYVFGDFCNGKVWGLLPGDGGNWSSSELFSTGVNISSFGEDVFGELYLISHNGTIYKLVKN